MVDGAIPIAKEEEPKRGINLSCTFCGPGTWATWDVFTEDCVVFACDRHHAEMSQSKIILFERMRGRELWNEIPKPKQIFYEEYLDDSKDLNDYE